MRHIKLRDELESFTDLPGLPDCSHISQGKVLLDHIKKRSSIVQRRRLSLVLDCLSLPEGGSLLEIGPGSCNLALEFCMRGFNFHGYDMVEENAEVWRIIQSQYGLEGNVKVQDICTVDTRNQECRFDGIFAISTFEHIHERSKALENCYKLLKPGGRILIIDGNILDPRLIFNMMFKREDGGILWLFNKGKVYQDYGLGWKGKCEDVKSVFWWKRQLKKSGFSVVGLSTTSAFRGWIRKLGVWPFLGSVIALGEKE